MAELLDYETGSHLIPKAKNPKNVVVLGGGITGLMTANKLLEGGHKVTLVEKKDVIGGIGTSFKYKEHMVDYGPHKIYTQIPRVMDEIERLLGDRLLDVPKRSQIRLLGKYYDYPVGLKDMLLKMNPWIGVRSGLLYGVSAVKGLLSKPEDNTYEDYVVNRFGKGVYELIFAQYARKVWGNPKELSSELARTRIAQGSLLVVLKNMIVGNKGDPTVSADVFRYPKDGFIEFPEILAKEIKQKKGTILMESTPTEIVTKDKKVTGVKIKGPKGKEETVKADYVISTIPLPLTLPLIKPAPPKKVMEHSKGLKFRSLVLLYLVVKRDRIFNLNWIFYPEEEFCFNRLSETKGFSPHMGPKDETVLMVEITVENDDPLLKADDKTVYEHAIEDLVRAGVVTKDEVKDYFTRKVMRIYPVYDLAFQDNIAGIMDYLDSVEGLIANGRQGLFNYNNTDHCTDMGIVAAMHVNNEGTNEDWARARDRFKNYRIVD